MAMHVPYPCQSHVWNLYSSQAYLIPANSKYFSNLNVQHIFLYNTASTYDVRMINKAARTRWWYRVNKVADRGPSSIQAVYLNPYSLLLPLYPLLDKLHPFPNQWLLQLQSTWCIC